MDHHFRDLDEYGLDSLVIGQEVNHLASVLAKNTTLPCIIYGETGTGKEEYAKLIHRRRELLEGKVPFVSVNCAHLNTDLAVSILFGHVKGSFSGADRNSRGLIEEANGGILFLDEVHALSLDAQQRLLRVLNDGSYTRLGETRTLYSRFQAITASTKDLDALIEKGEFLLDFRSRLTGIDVHLKPLRERKEDIPALLRLFLRQKELEGTKGLIDVLTKKCQQYHWQGNIRQLFSVLKAWYAMCEGKLDPDKLPCLKTMLPPRAEAGPAPMHDQFAPLINAVERAIFLDSSLAHAMESVERFILKAALELHPSIRDVYVGLDISRNNLYHKRRRYGLTEPASLSFSTLAPNSGPSRPPISAHDGSVSQALPGRPSGHGGSVELRRVTRATVPSFSFEGESGDSAEELINERLPLREQRKRS